MFLLFNIASFFWLRFGWLGIFCFVILVIILVVGGGDIPK
jgi:hypothetical protein